MIKKTMSCISALLACCMLAGCSGVTQTTGQGEPYVTVGAADSQDDENYIAGLTAANDFYGYLNADDLMKMELGPTKSYIGTWTLIGNDTKEQLDSIIKEIAESDKDYAPGSNEQLIHDFYWQVYDLVSSDKKNSEEDDTVFIESYINRIEAVSSVDELITMWHDLSAELALPTAFYGLVFNNPVDTREKLLLFHFTTFTKLEEIKNNNLKATQARDNLISYLRLCGVPADEAKQRATDIIYMYYEIAGYSDPLVLSGENDFNEDVRILTRDECSAMLKNLTYEQLMSAVGYDGRIPDRIAVEDPGQITGVDSLINHEHLRAWKDLALVSLLSNYSMILPYKYATAGFDGVTPEKNALAYVKKFLDKQVSEIYVERHFNEKKKELISRMCSDMVAEYHDLINGADWLTDGGKSFLTEKLDHMEFFIGGGEPHETDPADAELIGSTLLQTAYNYDRDSKQKEFADLFIEKPVNGFDSMSPATVNACYLPKENIIVIPAAVLNKRMFDEDADYAWNLGAIGTIIGHEISHAFDSNGVKFDAYGNYRPDAMPEEDVKAFKAMQEKAIAYYNSFKVLGSHVDGKLTLGENLADISGFQCALSIAGDLESKKTVFESYAKMRKMLISDIMAKDDLINDVHSPESVRVNAVVPLFDEFYEIYDVKESDPMYVSPENRIRRW